MCCFYNLKGGSTVTGTGTTVTGTTVTGTGTTVTGTGTTVTGTGTTIVTTTTTSPPSNTTVLTVDEYNNLQKRLNDYLIAIIIIGIFTGLAVFGVIFASIFLRSSIPKVVRF